MNIGQPQSASQTQAVSHLPPPAAETPEATRGADRERLPPVEASASSRDRMSREQVDQEQLEQVISNLKQRDREVRQHERMHAAVAGAHGGTPDYSFTRGPDGILYAVSGSVSVDVSPVPGNAEATLAKAEIIARAAMAPQNPSPADRAVAGQARSMAMQARVEIQAERQASLDAADGAESGPAGEARAADAVVADAGPVAASADVDGDDGVETSGRAPLADPAVDPRVPGAQPADGQTALVGAAE